MTVEVTRQNMPKTIVTMDKLTIDNIYPDGTIIKDDIEYRVINYQNLFTGCTLMTDISNVYINATNFDNCFMNCKNLVNVHNITLDGFLEGYQLFRNCYKVTDLSSVVLQGNYTYPYGISNWFADCYNLTDIPQFIGFRDLYKAFRTFANCYNLVNAPMINFVNTSNTQNMFSACVNLVNVPEYIFTFPKPLSNCLITRMFNGCNNLSNASIQNIVNMIISIGTHAPSGRRNLSNADVNSPLYGTKFDNSYYSNRWTDLTNAGWSY